MLNASPAYAYFALPECNNARWSWWQKRVSESGATSRFYTRDPEYNFGGGFWAIDGGNNYFAQGDGAQSWNEYRSNCAKPGTPLNGHHFSQVELGTTRNALNMADNYNMFGYVNFANPPSDTNSVCRADAFVNRTNWWAMTCVHATTQGSLTGNYYTRDWGIAINVNTTWRITTDMSKAGYLFLQSMAAHEFGHVLGLAHPAPEEHPDEDQNCDFFGNASAADRNLALTMYACQAYDIAAYAYTLGLGDMYGADAQT